MLNVNDKSLRGSQLEICLECFFITQSMVEIRHIG